MAKKTKDEASTQEAAPAQTTDSSGASQAAAGQGNVLPGDSGAVSQEPTTAPKVVDTKAEHDNPHFATKDEAPKLTVGRQVHYYFEDTGEPHSATVVRVKGGSITLAVICPHSERTIFKKDAPYSKAPKARHYSLPPRV